MLCFFIFGIRFFQVLFSSTFHPFWSVPERSRHFPLEFFFGAVIFSQFWQFSNVHAASERVDACTLVKGNPYRMCQHFRTKIYLSCACMLFHSLSCIIIYLYPFDFGSPSTNVKWSWLCSTWLCLWICISVFTSCWMHIVWFTLRLRVVVCYPLVRWWWRMWIIMLQWVFMCSVNKSI